MHKIVQVLEVFPDGRNQRIKDLRVVDLEQKLQRTAARVFVRVQQLLVGHVVRQDDIPENFGFRVVLVDNLEVVEPKLVQMRVFMGKDVTDENNGKDRDFLTAGRALNLWRTWPRTMDRQKLSKSGEAALEPA